MPSLEMEQLDAKTLDDILEKMINTIINSQNQIFKISEKSREQSETILKELEITKYDEEDRVVKNRNLEERAAAARLRLAELNKHFGQYGSEEIREAYELANQVQFELSGALELKEQLSKKRSDLEQQWAGLRETVEHAETLIGRVSVVLNYLNGDLRKISSMMEEIPDQQVFGLTLVEAQEEERQRLSREIHDGPAQILAHVLLNSEVTGLTQKEEGQEASGKESAHLRELVRRALSDVRRIIYDLRPMALDDLGLVPTVEKYLNEVREQEDLVISLTKGGNPRPLPVKMESALFRLVQESVQNVCKHAEASGIKMEMTFHADNVHLIVADDGKGFDPKEHKRKSFGIVGMKERVELLEGELSIASNPGNGTVVMIQIPIQTGGMLHDKVQ